MLLGVEEAGRDLKSHINFSSHFPAMKSLLSLCLLLLSGQLFAQDTQNPCLTATGFHIVVLGSSTAAGTGPSTQDSAWVWRYRRYVQEINPQNLVTNLGVGGTTTYHILPDGSTPPAGRPLPTPAKNISQAISLGADAIIVNMPSNDAAIGFTVTETLANFRMLDSVANQAGIPIWICTTQPRNFSAAARLVQVEVKDSVLAQYGAFAIDFWNGFADSTFGIDPVFDSGDGVHMNDTAHAVLLSLVAEENILSAIYTPSPVADIAVTGLIADSEQICGSMFYEVKAAFTNIGEATIADLPFEWQVTTALGSSVVEDTVSGGLGSCESDTISLMLNTAAGGDFVISFSSELSADTFLLNNQLGIQRNLKAVPNLTAFPDTVCEGNSAQLLATLAGGDTIFWYDQPIGGSIMGGGPVFVLPMVDSLTTLYAQGVLGDLFFKKSLFTRDATNRTWNGVMFDLIGHADIIIDSLDTKVFTTGNGQVVEVYTKSGGHQGFENDVSAWTLWITDTLDVPVADQVHPVDLQGIGLNAGDTTAVYLKFQDPASRLYYEAVPSAATRSTAELSLFSGTGISHAFGTTYFPRDWAGEVYYHFGDNAEGDCATARIPVTASIANPEPDLGSDLSLPQGDSAVITPGIFWSYLWSDGSTDPTYVVASSTLPGEYLIAVTVSDKFGCTSVDSIIVTVLLTDAIDEGIPGLIMYPNPASRELTIEGVYEKIMVELTDLQGKRIVSTETDSSKISLPDLPDGIYLLRLVVNGKAQTQKLLIQR